MGKVLKLAEYINKATRFKSISLFKNSIATKVYTSYIYSLVILFVMIILGSSSVYGTQIVMPILIINIIKIIILPVWFTDHLKTVHWYICKIN